MSELINKNDNRTTIRWKLLTGASALALTAYASSAGLARAEDSDRPQVWIELGGQFSRLQDAQEPFAPPLMDARPSVFAPSQKFEKPPLYSVGEQGMISFQPEDSNWVFSASIQYGRSVSNKHVNQRTDNPYTFSKYPGYIEKLRHLAAKFAETRSRNSEQHAILDFQAGKDVGLGMFGGRDGSSVVSLGVRFAQFGSNSNIALKSDPDWKIGTRYYYSTPPNYKLATQNYHSNAATLNAQRKFHGVGPLLSWKASAPFAGNSQEGELTFDWGVNAALLFGKQRTRIHHHTTEQFHSSTGLFLHPGRRTTVYQTSVSLARSRSVTVPNVGGFAGLSVRYSDAKISVGYKADFFFGAIDGGVDGRKSENRGFYGPYASISIGLGD